MMIGGVIVDALYATLGRFPRRDAFGGCGDCDMIKFLKRFLGVVKNHGAARDCPRTYVGA